MGANYPPFPPSLIAQAAGAVRFDIAQALSGTQQTQALANINATSLTTFNAAVNDFTLTINGINNSITNLNNTKLDKNAPITAATKTKITYDVNGLVTSGTDATTADINDSTNRRYVTNAQLVVIGNTSGTNTGDETTASIKTKLGAASASQDGYLTLTDWSTFNNKQNTLTNIVTAGTYGSSTQIPVVTVLANGLVDEITLVNVAGGDVVLSATGTTLTLAAGVNYRILVSANTTIDCSALTGTVQFINVQTNNRTLTFTATPQTVFDVTGGALASVVLTGFTQAWLAPNPSVANTLRYTKHGQVLASDMSWAATGGSNSSSNRMTWSAASFSGARTYTLVDKDVNFGDLPSVATTNSNSISGTRLSCTGGSANTITGTDNSCLNSSNNTVSGSNNTVVSGGGSSLGNTVAGNNNQLNNCQLCITNSSSTFVYLDDCKNVDASNLVRVKQRGVDLTGYTTKNVQWCDGSEVIGIDAIRLKAICALQTAITVNTAVTLTQLTAATYTKPIAFMQSNGLGDYEGATHYVYLDIQNQTVSGSSKATYKVDVDNSTVIASQLIGTSSNSGTAPTYTVAFTVTGTGANARLNITVTISNVYPSFLAMAIVESYYF